MATKEEMMEKYVAQLKALGKSVDDEALEGIVDGLGPANYNLDASLVAASDPEELRRVYTNFVADELAISDEEKGMEMIAKVAEEMSSEARKYRAVFYYLLSKMV